MIMAETSRSASTERSTPTPDAPQRVASIVRPGEGQRVRAFENEIEFMVTAEQTAGSLTVGLASVPVGNGPPPHVHYADDELFLIVEGEYRIYLNGEWANVGPGTAVYLPRGSVHTFQVVGTVPGRHWTLQTPSGFERYFARSAEVFAAPGPPDFARLAEITAEYGAELVQPAAAEAT
jgi:mannose-6-phosphate isomerase-like protein (cupin superfamily)